MSKIEWDAPIDRKYETGVNHAVLYPDMGTGVAWNGITSVTDSSEGGEPVDLYADNMKYASMRENEDFSGTIEAYQAPKEFAECDGTKELVPGLFLGQQQYRKPFALVYRTEVGNAAEGLSSSYKLHFVFNATASPAEKSYETISDSPDAITFSWEFKSTPIATEYTRPTSTMTVDSSRVNAKKLKEIEDILYGTDETDPQMLTPDMIVWILKSIDPRAVFAEALYCTKRWKWDTFSFTDDTVTAAIEREAIRMTFKDGEDLTEAVIPYIIFEEAFEEGSLLKRYKVTLIDDVDNSKPAKELAKMPTAKFIEKRTDGNHYYYSYYITF